MEYHSISCLAKLMYIPNYREDNKLSEKLLEWLANMIIRWIRNFHIKIVHVIKRKRLYNDSSRRLLNWSRRSGMGEYFALRRQEQDRNIYCLRHIAEHINTSLSKICDVKWMSYSLWQFFKSYIEHTRLIQPVMRVWNEHPNKMCYQVV